MQGLGVLRALFPALLSNIPLLASKSLNALLTSPSSLAPRPTRSANTPLSPSPSPSFANPITASACACQRFHRALSFAHSSTHSALTAELHARVATAEERAVE